MLDENVRLKDVRRQVRSFWTLLTFSGYLKAEDTEPPDSIEVGALRLSIPNREVRQVFRLTFYDWLDQALEPVGATVEQFSKALLSGDSAGVKNCLQSLMTDLLSYHDVPYSEIEPIIHVFTLGLLAVVELGYQVRSKRESGKGRPDILIKPVAAGQPGAVLEFNRIGARSRRWAIPRLHGNREKSASPGATLAGEEATSPRAPVTLRLRRAQGRPRPLRLRRNLTSLKADSSI